MVTAGVDRDALGEYVEHFGRRVLQDALAEATASYWNRRARAFAAVGTEKCDRIAEACRNAAAVALIADEPPIELDELWSARDREAIR